MKKLTIQWILTICTVLFILSCQKELSIEGEVVEQSVGTAIQMPQSGDLTEPRVKHGVNYVAEGVRYALVMANFG